jgi:hypothetical protein
MAGTGRLYSRALAALAAVACSPVVVCADDAKPVVSQPVVRAVTRGPTAPALPKKEVANLRSRKQPQRPQVAANPKPQSAGAKVPRAARQASGGPRKLPTTKPAAVVPSPELPTEPPESSRVTRSPEEQSADAVCERLPPGPAIAPSFVAIRGPVLFDAAAVLALPKSEQADEPDLTQPPPVRPATTVKRRQAASTGRERPARSVPSPPK